jgi:hypothetical protein
VSYSRPSPAEIPPALLDPTPTADKMVAAANAVLRVRRPKRRPLPGLDVAALAKRYGGDPANTQQTRTAVFRVPLGVSWDAYRAVRDRRIASFLKVLESKGYRLIPRAGAIRVAPGIYPATHPETGTPLLDQREFRVEVDCSFPNAEPVVIRLDPEDLAPIDHKER